MQEPCYICLEEKEYKKNKFLPDNICNCKNLKIHQQCFYKLENKFRCSVCKEKYKNIKIVENRNVLRITNEGFMHLYKYNRKNNISGKYLLYYPDGNLCVNASYQNGKLHGQYYMLYQDRKIREIALYNLGGREKIYSKWYSNGMLEEVIEYKKGKINGKYETFDESGNISSQISFKEDKFDGSFKLYHSNGRIYKESIMKENKYNGRSKEWDNNGILKKDLEYDNNVLVKDCYHIPNCFSRFWSKIVTKILYKKF